MSMHAGLYSKHVPIVPVLVKSWSDRTSQFWIITGSPIGLSSSNVEPWHVLSILVRKFVVPGFSRTIGWISVTCSSVFRGTFLHMCNT